MIIGVPKELIESGLDFMIYSFDGGTEKTYEKMRPGRFKENNFSEVYENIKRFHTIKSASHSALPYTKIQMILTDETFNEMDSFFALFSEFVDDVSTSQYTERGGQLNAIDDETKDSYEKALNLIRPDYAGKLKQYKEGGEDNTVTKEVIDRVHNLHFNILLRIQLR